MAGWVVGRLSPRVGRRVVLLHEVRDPRRFHDKIAWLRAYYDIVSLDDLINGPSTERTKVALTFDDGYRSWYDEAASILDAFAVPAVFFVCSGFIGLRTDAARAFCHHRLRRRTSLEPLDISQLRALAAHPLFDIGSHTVHHIDLGAASADAELDAEIGGDRRRLEDWIGRRVRWFAYPFGQPENTSSAARAYLADQGFAGAFTLVPAFVDGADQFAVGRDSLAADDPEWVWAGRLSGGYDGLDRLSRRLRGRR